MDCKALSTAANKVIIAIDTQAPPYVSANILASIKNQMVFIRDNAATGNNPAKESASGAKFTYAILALSRISESR
jgi:hypothetical protein